jgi:large subunit ribosomal protein L22
MSGLGSLMIAKAEGKFLRISPSKVRQVMDLIRLKDVLVAQNILNNLNKRPKEYLVKLLKSAIANAKNKGFNIEQLYVSKIICNVGPTWKRFKAAAFGRAAPIKKRTAHIRIELDVKVT